MKMSLGITRIRHSMFRVHASEIFNSPSLPLKSAEKSKRLNACQANKTKPFVLSILKHNVPAHRIV